MENEKRFLNLTQQEALTVHHPVYLNAKELKKSSQILEQSCLYGPAASLAILSLEEVVKSSLILMHGHGVRVFQLKDAKKFFYDHKIRHQVAVIFELIGGAFDALLESENKAEKPKIETGVKWLDWFFDKVPTYLDSTKLILVSVERSGQLTEFNTLKNQGFYCDYFGELISPKTTVTKDKCHEISYVVERIFTFYKTLRIIYHPKASNHIITDGVDYREGIKELSMLVNKMIKEQ